MSIRFVVPGEQTYHLEQVVFDLNGTLATGGIIAPATLALLDKLAQHLTLNVVTADTHGTAGAMQALLGATAKLVLVEGTNTAAAKAALVQQLGADKIVAVGNGANDAEMFEAAALAIAIVGAEGCCATLLAKANLLVTHIDDALTLLLEPDRIVATLRR